MKTIGLGQVCLLAALLGAGCAAEDPQSLEPFDPELAASKSEAYLVQPLLGPPRGQLAGPILEFAITGDGYTADEQQLLRQHAQAFIAKLSAVEPFRTYHNLLRFWLVPAISARSDLNVDETRCETAWCCRARGPRTMECDDGRIESWAARLSRPIAHTIMLVNTSAWRGTHYDSYTPAMGSEPDVVVHEFGHALDLADEYLDAEMVKNWDLEKHPPPVRSDGRLEDAPNCGATNAWPEWRSDGTLGTPVAGCLYSEAFFRSGAPCRMEDPTTEEFCPVCREHLLTTLYRRAGGPIAAVSPPSEKPVALGRQPLTFELTLTGSATGALWVDWRLDGKSLPAAAAQTLDGCELKAGSHQLQVTVRDLSPFVRSATAKAALTAQRSWRIDATCP